MLSKDENGRLIDYINKVVNDENSKPEIIRNLKTAQDLIKQQKYTKANKMIMKILEINPFNHNALYLLSILYYAQKNYMLALKLIERAINISPDNYWNYIIKSSICHSSYLMNYDEDAMALAKQSIRAAVDIAPMQFEVREQAGLIYLSANALDEAKEEFEKALSIKPGDERCNYFFSALSGKNIDKAPKQYVENLFDEYAIKYDQHLTFVLQSSVPISIVDNIEKIANPEQKYKILDLGSGTGLVGEYLLKKGNIKFVIDGVDISGKMVNIAKSKNIYNNVTKAEISSYLTEINDQYDIVTASDVMIYIGELEPIFAMVKKILVKNGYFIFSTEDSESQEGFELKKTLRYGFSDKYITDLAQKYGLNIISKAHQFLRKDKDEGISGTIYTIKN